MNQDTTFWIAQGISVIAGILAICMMQFKNMKTILLFQIIVNLTASLNYLLLGGDSGAIVMFIYNTKNVKPHIPIIVIFICGYLSASIFNIVTTRDLMELFPAIAAFCFSVSLAQKRASVFRIWGMLNPLFWLPYDIYTSSYVMFAVHFGILVSSVIAIVRLDTRWGRSKR